MFHYVRQNLTSGLRREITYEIDFVEIGRFGIYKMSKMMDMSIHVEPEHRGKGIARQMMQMMLQHMSDEGSYVPTDFIYIDTDASEGFWDHIGLVPNPNVEDRSKPEYGYEKRISMKSLNRFVYYAL